MKAKLWISGGRKLDRTGTTELARNETDTEPKLNCFVSFRVLSLCRFRGTYSNRPSKFTS